MTLYEKRSRRELQNMVQALLERSIRTRLGEKLQKRNAEPKSKVTVAGAGATTTRPAVSLPPKIEAQASGCFTIEQDGVNVESQEAKINAVERLTTNSPRPVCWRHFFFALCRSAPCMLASMAYP